MRRESLARKVGQAAGVVDSSNLFAVVNHRRELDGSLAAVWHRQEARLDTDEALFGKGVTAASDVSTKPVEGVAPAAPLWLSGDCLGTA